MLGGKQILVFGIALVVSIPKHALDITRKLQPENYEYSHVSVEDRLYHAEAF